MVSKFLRRSSWLRPSSHTLLATQESEGEEAGESRVTLAQDLGRGNLAARQSRVHLQEVGNDGVHASIFSHNTDFKQDGLSHLWVLLGDVIFARGSFQLRPPKIPST